jgi:hypothetical protein
MTWLEFMVVIMSQGVKDDTEIGHIHWDDGDDGPVVTPYGDGGRVGIDGDVIDDTTDAPEEDSD